MFLGIALILFGSLVYVGRRKLYKRNLEAPMPTPDDRARGARWNAVFGAGAVTAGVILTVIGLIQRL